MSKILIIIPYFGRWPFWMPYFLETCRWNSTIDWLLYSDCGSLPDISPNVRVIEMSYQAYCERVSESLAIVFAPKSPYKLCDIKPALGYIHAVELKGYDFWAFGDIDLVYGDLRLYFTERRLASKDIFSTHATRISGHLCVFRNNDELRTAFMRIDGWQKKLAQQEHLAFDEKDFSKIFLRHKNSPNWLKALSKKLDSWLVKAEFNEAYTTPNGRITWLDGSNEFPQFWVWERGKLSNERCRSDEFIFPYFHFLVWKNDWKNQDTTADKANKASFNKHRFVIDKNGFSTG